MALQPGLCEIWLETQKTGFLLKQLKLSELGGGDNLPLLKEHKLQWYIDLGFLSGVFKISYFSFVFGVNYSNLDHTYSNRPIFR